MSSAGDGQRAPGMSHITPTAPDMDNPPGRYDVTVRVARDDGHSLPDPAAFAVAASRAASSRDAGVLSAHTAEEIICVVGVATPGRPSAVASPWPSSPARSRLKSRSGHPVGAARSGTLCGHLAATSSRTTQNRMVHGSPASFPDADHQATGFTTRQSERVPWRTVGTDITSLGTPALIWIVCPVLGVVIAASKTATMLTIIGTALFGSPGPEQARLPPPTLARESP